MPRADNLTTFMCRLSRNSVILKILEPLGRIIGLYRDYLNSHVKVTESGAAHNRAAVKGRARTFNLVIKC